MRKWVFLAGAILAEVAATLSLRVIVDSPEWLPATVLGYVVTVVLLGATIKVGMPVGVAYGIWGAVGVAGVAALASVLFDEHLSEAQLAGIALVIVGVFLVEIGSRPSPEHDLAEGRR
jgi:small multidrug resistance pump